MSTAHCSVKKVDFDGEEAFLLENAQQMRVKILSYGGALLSVEVPDNKGVFENVTLSLQDAKAYTHNSCFAGAVVGPSAGRLKNAEFFIDDIRCSLTKNDGEHNLHGGIHNLSNVHWSLVDSFSDDSTATLHLRTTLAHGLGGFPGNRSVELFYLLDNTNTLTLHFTATTDKKTFFSLTNHAYWNLSGDFTKSALQQTLQIFSDEVLYTDAQHLPLKRETMAHTAFDFSLPQKPADLLKQYEGHEQLQIARGYDHPFVLTSGAPRACILRDEGSGRSLCMTTDLPALVFYSGGFLDEDVPLANEISATPSCALALEAQMFPNAPNTAWLPCAYLLPEKPMSHFISWTFSNIKNR